MGLLLLAQGFADNAELGAMALVALALVKVLDKAWDARVAKNAKDNGEDPLHAMLTMIVEIHKDSKAIKKNVIDTFEMHNVRDEDGLLRWMVPRAWQRIQLTMVESLGEQKVLTKRVISLLETLLEDQKETHRRQEKQERLLTLLMDRFGGSEQGRIGA